MSRLTCKYDGDNTLRELCTFDRASDIEADGCMTCSEYCDTIDVLDITCSDCAIQKAFDKLAEYEDLEEKGLLLKLPCKIGDIIYEVDEGILFDDVIEPIECKVTHILIVSKVYIEIEVIKGHGVGSTYNFEIEDFNKTVFLTKEEAEKELERLNNEKN